MKCVTNEALVAGANTLNETLKYSCATAEYSGLVTLSYIRRGGGFIYDPLAKAASPVCDAAVTAYQKTAGGLGWTYEKATSGIGSLLKAIPLPGKKMRDVEERLRKIEEWMANIDEHGLVMSPSMTKGVKKKLSEEKEALLKNILIDNMDLKGLG